MNKIIVKYIPPNKWWQNPTWELQAPYISHNKNITVPAGYITDGASIPFIARILFSPTGRYFGAAIVHDYVITDIKNFRLANREMDALGITPWRKNIIMSAVKIWSQLIKI